MHEAMLKEHVYKLLDKAIAETAHNSRLKGLHRELRLSRQRLEQPMRVAIVGLIKAGKSTLMNALLGETIVATGLIEATFNVNWLKYGPTTSLMVHFKDNSPPEPRSLEELDRLTRRSKEHLEYLLRIKYIEVFYSNALLQIMNLIDTPGLASFYKDDSEGTKEFLKLYGAEITHKTKAEAEYADAVLYLFSHNIGEADTSTIELFQGSTMGQASPINSIGVLTKVDALWPTSCDNALEGGQEIVTRIQNDHPQIRHLFYAIIPLCGSLAWGAQTLTSEEFDTLVQLAQLPEKVFQRIIKDAKRLTERDYPDVPVAPALREAVYNRLGQYGIWHAYNILRAEGCTHQQLIQALLPHSGLSKLKELLLSHFGNRAFLIKLDNALSQLDKACFWARQREDIRGTDREILRRVEREIEALRDQEQGFRELKVLRDYYQGKLHLTAKEIHYLLQITGEYGTSDRQRLGLTTDVDEHVEESLRETLATAKKYAGYWRRRAIDPGASREMENAAIILGDAYDRISYQTMETMKQQDITI